MADALASGASVRKDVGVQVPPRPQVMEANLDPNALSLITWFKGAEHLWNQELAARTLTSGNRGIRSIKNSLDDYLRKIL